MAEASSEGLGSENAGTRLQGLLYTFFVLYHGVAIGTPGLHPNEALGRGKKPYIKTVIMWG